MQNLDYELLPGDPIGQRLCQIFGAYRWSVIESDMPTKPDKRPQWRTIGGYEVRPRVFWQRWQDPDQLVGVRFTKETCYALIDIDAGSRYWSSDAIADIQAALETIGIVRSLLVRSSARDGIHLYIPLPEPISTFNLAVALDQCLRAHGFQVKDGQLEIFPNVKAYGVQAFTNYKAHRLPLQPGSGSYLLDSDLLPIPDGESLRVFFQCWDVAADGQDLPMLQAALVAGRWKNRKQRRKPLDISKVEAWKQDLETEIAEGWTGYSQTNRLLKTIACYGVVFEGLSQQSLIEYIVNVASNCPGYTKYCRHQHNLHRRAADWAKAAENYYWPLGSRPLRTTAAQPKGPSPNELRSQDAQQRIRAAVQQLLNLGELPVKVRSRLHALVKLAKTSASTLYRYPALWHPQHYTEPDSTEHSPQPLEQPQPLSQMPVTPDFALSSALNSTSQSANYFSLLESSKCLLDEVLHPIHQFMKSLAFSPYSFHIL